MGVLRGDSGQDHGVRRTQRRLCRLGGQTVPKHVSGVTFTFTFHTNVQLHDFTANYLSLLHSLSQKGGRPRSNQPQMEENQIYVSVEEGKVFLCFCLLQILNSG